MSDDTRKREKRPDCSTPACIRGTCLHCTAYFALGEPKIQRAWEKALANRAALDGCTMHEFRDTTPEKKIGKRWKCTHCSGEIDEIERIIYDQGVAHGRATANIG
jgi:hypothetical protein